MEETMYVIKRDGSRQEISFDKILQRIKNIGDKANIHLNWTQLAMKVIDRLYNDIETKKIDEFTAEHCATMASTHLNYGVLASHIILTNHQKNTNHSFSETMYELYQSDMITKEFYGSVKDNAESLDELVDHDRDFLIDYFGFKTLERAYLLKNSSGKIIERIQHMWMRTSVCIHKTDIQKIKETYNLMSQKFFTHATPTLFNAGTPVQQLSSCFLVAMEEDSIDGIFDTLKDCAKISKYAGGIGLHVHNIRGKGSSIGKKNTSSGLPPMLRVYNNTARFVDQGGKRNGSFAIYLEPWHLDIEDFLEMRKNHGDEEMKARDLFYGLWIPDLFMERVKSNSHWHLFCPNDFPNLFEVYGDEFKILYEKYESECGDKLFKKINARDLWFKILDSQMETGTPYLLYKDAANKKSNQQNLGTIKSSNLCTEIIEYTSDKETAVCNLASIGLPKFVENGKFNYKKLHEVVEIVTENLNNVIDITFYPTEKARNSNLRHRPIGIGVQGLADVFFMLDIPYHSQRAKEINQDIFETIYHASLEKSCELSLQRCELVKLARQPNEICTPEEFGMRITNQTYGSYSSFVGSPASDGKLQFDLWGVKPHSDRYNWDELKEKIVKYGLRNSLCVAPMPTASTSQILGYNECFEPITGNIYSRRTLAGEFIVVNRYLMKELIELNIWNENLKNNIIENKGSIQHLDIPQHIKDKYKIVWEIPMRHLIDMSADRGIYICQSQSLNLWVEDPNYNILTSMHFYSWSKGLKTGCYYLRRKPKHTAQQFTIEPEKQECELCSA
jgi:ribonucleotide reductase alpha subunit